MDYNNKPKGYYDNSRTEMLSYLPENFKTVLDVGCADGSFAELIKDNYKSEVWGVEYMPDEAKKAAERIDKVYVGAIEDNFKNLPDNYFDVIYYNDVLEHLADPYTVLEKMRSKLSKNGIAISSIPNMRYHRALKELVINKDWKYAEHGTLDKTHLRFFTKKSIYRMYQEAQYDIVLHKGLNPSKSIKPWLYNIPFLFTALDMRYLQFVTIAKAKL